MPYINESAVRILRGLATYKFLTNEQLRVLAGLKDASPVRLNIKKLQTEYNGIIDYISFQVVPKVGRLHNIYFLTPKGALFASDVLDIDEGEIKYPVGKVTMTLHDYEHRIATVDFWIAFRQWAESCGHSVQFTDSYFDKTGANRNSSERLRAKTKIDMGDKYIIPDGAAMFEAEARRYLFLLEIYNGNDTKRVIEQIEKHAQAIGEGTPSQKYEHRRSNYVALVFETQGAMEAVMRRMREAGIYSELKRHFIFKNLYQAKTNFYSGWSLFDGSTVKFI